tara:strand:- start:803 stop:4309 length:3507 start_codon:yes stop_codon:yes gene_type:complete
VKVNKISLKQVGGEQQNQPVDPAMQQMTEFISNSINEGQDPVDIVVGLVGQEIDPQTIAQAFITVGYKEEDIISLFEAVKNKSQPSEPASNKEQTQNPQEIARNQALELEAKAAEEQEAQQAQAAQRESVTKQQDEMSQTLTAKSGIEINPENKGKFTRWARSRGMSVSEAYNKVMSNTKNYSKSVVKMANFAKNAAGWKKEEGGEFTPHLMYKGSNTQKADTYQEHLKLKESGYTHKKAQGGTETNTVNKPDVFTNSPAYLSSIATNNKDFNIGTAAQTLGNEFSNLFGNNLDSDGNMQGAFRDGKRKQAQQNERVGSYYNYDLTIDPNDPNTYGFDNTDLYNASQSNLNGLRTSEQFTNDVNENSRVNYNTETGKYDSLMSSRPLNEDIYGEKKGLFGNVIREENNALSGENLNYFNNYEDGEVRDLILGTQDDPEGTTLGINEQGQASSYAPGADNPYQYDTMMGYNSLADDSQPPAPQQNVQDKLDELSMIPTGSNGQPEPAMGSAPMEGGPTSTQSGPRTQETATTERPSFSEWRIQNAINFQGKSQSDLQEIYNSIGDDEFRYGGSLRQAGDGWFDDALNYTQTALSTAGLTPAFGIIPDAINTVISGARVAGDYITGADPTKNWTSLGLNAGSMVPVVGQASGVASIANDVNNYANNATSVPQNTTSRGPMLTENYNYNNDAQSNVLRRGGGLPKAQGGNQGGNDHEFFFPDLYEINEELQQGEQPQQSITAYPTNNVQEKTDEFGRTFAQRMREEGEAYTSGQLNSSNMQEPSDMDLLGDYGIIPQGATGSNGIDQMGDLEGIQDIELEDDIVEDDIKYKDPKVKRKNKIQGGFNRMMDSNQMNKFTAGSTAAVNIAKDVINPWFDDKKVDEAIVNNRNNSVADVAYGTKEDPSGKRGNFTLNDGSFRPGDDVAPTGTAQVGTEITPAVISQSFMDEMAEDNRAAVMREQELRIQDAIARENYDDLGAAQQTLMDIKSGMSSAYDLYGQAYDVAEEYGLDGVLRHLDPIAKTSDLFDNISIPSNLVAEFLEWKGGLGDGEFNFSDAMPGLEGNFSGANYNGTPTKNPANVLGVEGFWNELAVNIILDPTSYLGAGLFRNITQKMGKNAPKWAFEFADDIVRQSDDAVKAIGTKKQGGETANVDSTILAKLIAAGADIEIL